jgi:GntR family transcriptional regulator
MRPVAAAPVVAVLLGVEKPGTVLESGDRMPDQPPRRRVVRCNERHQWEKDRARQLMAVRAGTGGTEHDTGLAVTDLVFSASYRRREAGPELAGEFGVRPGTALLERVYRTRYEKEAAPFDVSRSFLVRDHIAANPKLLDETNEPWPGGTQHQLLTVGIEVARVVERIIAARPPSREESETLGMAPGTAVIVLRKTCHDTTGRVVEVSDVLLPGDRTELRFVTALAAW